jgi:hypothetical protein
MNAGYYQLTITRIVLTAYILGMPLDLARYRNPLLLFLSSEQDRRDLLRSKLHLLSARLLCHGWIILDTGSHGHIERPIAHTSYYLFCVEIRMSLDATHDRFIANRSQRCGLGLALRDISRELLRNVGHHDNQNRQLTTHLSVLARKFAHSVTGVLDVHLSSHGSAKNATRRRFIDPRTLRLSVAHTGHEHYHPKQKFA